MLLASSSGLRRVIIRFRLKTTLVGVADFNSDGRVDLAAETVASDQVTLQVGVLLGARPRWIPQAGVPVGIGGEVTSHVGIADLDGNGAADVAVPSGVGLRVLLENGKGELRDAVDAPFPLLGCAYCGNGVAFPAEFDGDARMDVASGAACSVAIMFQTRTAPAIASARRTAAPDQAFATAGAVHMLAANAASVAAVVTAKGSCGHVVVWNTHARRSSSYDTPDFICRDRPVQERLHRRACARRGLGRVDRFDRRQHRRSVAVRRATARRQGPSARLRSQRERRR